MTGKDALAAKNARLCGPETRRMLNESRVAWFMPVANEYPTLYPQSFARSLVQSVKWLRPPTGYAIDRINCPVLLCNISLEIPNSLC